MKKLRFTLILSLLVIITIIVFLNDVLMVQLIEGIRSSSLDYVFLSVTFASNAFIIFFFLTTLFLWKEHKRRWIFPLWLSSFFAVSVSVFLKVLIKRPRPFHEGVVSVLQIAFHFMKNNFNTWNFSFPSFQAMLVFAAVPLLNKEFKKFRYIWFIFACLVAFSRSYFGVHYVSDIMTGGIIGYLIGFSMVILEEKYKVGLKLMKKLKISK